LNLVDSSGWIEFFTDGPKAGRFTLALSDPETLLVPTIVIYEVFKIILQRRGEAEALQAVAAMRQGSVADLTEEVALMAARAGLERRLPMADAVIWATARMHDAVILTTDEHFKGLPGVKYIPV
jgi:predicted nucleic acid-binding protein